MYIHGLPFPTLCIEYSIGVGHSVRKVVKGMSFLSFDWGLATSSLPNFLASGYFLLAVLLVVGGSVLSKIFRLLWLAGVLFLVWMLASFGIFDGLAGLAASLA